MFFQNNECSLKLEVVCYETPPDHEDRNWLVVRATWVNDEGEIIKDSNACLQTDELQAMTAGLKVLNAGIRSDYESDFVSPYFSLAAQAEQEGFRFYVSFFLPNTMDGDDYAELSCTMTPAEMKALIKALDHACAKFPERA